THGGADEDAPVAGLLRPTTGTTVQDVSMLSVSRRRPRGSDERGGKGQGAPRGRWGPITSRCTGRSGLRLRAGGNHLPHGHRIHAGCRESLDVEVPFRPLTAHRRSEACWAHSA